MPRPKQLTKETRKKGKQKNDEPQTADDILAAGVDFEEAGEKWRAGDAAKSTRFFNRAIEKYESGLQAFPQSFDLAYNRARVQYQLTQHPKLVAQLPTPLAELLQTALDYHRYALSLRPDDGDVLFNTAQVLTSVVETDMESVRSQEGQRSNSLTLLQEALDLLRRCLTGQEFRFAESQTLMDVVDDKPAVARMDDGKERAVISGSSEAVEDGQWASVLEPVTKDTLIDTAIAQLETLTLVCEFLVSDPGSGLAWVEENIHDLENKIRVYVEGTNRELEVAVARANLICALADTIFHAGRIDLFTYDAELNRAFGTHLDLSQHPHFLCDHAEALITLTTSVLHSLSLETGCAEDEKQSISTLLWQRLTTASLLLTSASKLPSAQNLANINIARGDVELRRLRLGAAPFDHAVARRNGATLVKNAETYYRGAVALAKNDVSADEEWKATVRLAIASAMAGEERKLAELKGRGRQDILTTVEEMVVDGIIDNESSRKLMDG